MRSDRLRLLDRIDVAAIRARTGLSQAALASRTRVYATTLRSWENGNRGPKDPPERCWPFSATTRGSLRDPLRLMAGLHRPYRAAMDESTWSASLKCSKPRRRRSHRAIAIEPKEESWLTT